MNTVISNPGFQKPHNLTHRVVGFIEHLRLNSFKLGPGETSATLTEIMTKTIGDKNIDHLKMKTLLTGSKQEWDSFDELFASYWMGRGKTRQQLQNSSNSSRTQKNLPRAWRDHLGMDDNDGNTPQIESTEATQPGQTASGKLVAVDQKSLYKIDLRQFVDPTEIAEAEALALKLASAIRYRLSRRYYNSKKTSRLDMRRTIRANLKYGGTPIDLRFKSTPQQPVRIIVFLTRIMDKRWPNPLF